MKPLGQLTRLLSLRPLRRRPLRAVLALAAVAAGTAMAVSVFVVQASARESVEDFSRTLAGPGELRVVGAVRRGGLESEVVDRVAEVDGVRSAVPLVHAVTLAGPRDEGLSSQELPVLALGVDCRVEALVGRFGCLDELVADRGDRPLARGPGLDEHDVLRTNTAEVSLAGVPRFDRLGDLGDGRFVVLPLAAAQRLFDRGDRYDVIYVEPDAGEDVADLKASLQHAVGPHNGVLDATQPPPEMVGALGDVLPLFTLVAVFALGMGAMLVYNTVTFSIEQRRRELGVVGALGGTRALAAATTLGEAGLLGVLGGLGGAALGLVVAGPIVNSLSTFTERVAGIPLTLHAGVGPLLVGAVLGLAVAVGAALPGARRATRVDVVGEIANRSLRYEASTPHLLRRAMVWGGLSLLGLALVRVAQRDGGLEAWQFRTGAVGFGLAALTMLLLVASLGPLVVRPLEKLVGRFTAGRLAWTNLVRSAGRTGVMVAALAAAVATAFVTSGFSVGITKSITRGVSTNMDGVQVSSVSSGANVNVDAGISPDALAALAEVPGVEQVHRSTVVLTGARSGEVMMVTAYEDPWYVRDGARGVRGTMDPQGFQQGEVLISTDLARTTGLRPDDLLSLPTPAGMVDVPIQAVVHGGGPGDGRVWMSYRKHLELYGQQPSRAVYVEAEPGTSPDQLAARIRAAGLGSDFRVETPTQVVADAEDSVADQIAPFWTLQRGLLAVSFVAVLSTMLLVGAQRGREMAMLAAIGSPPSALARMVLAEAAVVALAALVLGVLAGTVLLWAMTQLAPLMMGFPVPYTTDLLPTLAAGGLTSASAMVAAVWPARRAARAEVLPALRSE